MAFSDLLKVGKSLNRRKVSLILRLNKKELALH